MLLSEEFSEAKVKSFGLISLAEEISKQPSIDTALWILVLSLMKTYSEKEQAEQGKLQKVKLEEKKSTRK